MFNYGSDDVDEKTVDYGINMTLNAINLFGFDDNQIKNEQRNDPSLASVIKNCENSSDSKWNDYCLKNSILYHTELLEKSITENPVIPYQIREYVLSIYHNHKLGIVNMAMDKMITLFSLRFFWNGMVSDIKKWVTCCPKCIQIKDISPIDMDCCNLFKAIFLFKKLELTLLDLLKELKVEIKTFW